MKVKDCIDSFYYNSGKASDICRNLGFAGLALIWVFRVMSGEKPIIPCVLRWAGVLLLGGLALDFLQYIVGTIVWYIYYRFKERRNTPKDEEFLAPVWMNYPADTCFALKQIAIFVAYILLVISMFNSFWR